MHYAISVFLTGCCLLGIVPITAAQGQKNFSIGPRVGYTLSTANWQEASSSQTVTSGYRNGFEAGVAANFTIKHVSLQPAILYAQKGFTLDRVENQGSRTVFQNSTSYRLDYLTVPLNISWSSGSTGEGLQLFAGPYVGFLLGGRYTYKAQFNFNGSGPTSQEGAGAVKASNTAGNVVPDDNFYSRRIDAGAQAGIGYRYCGVLAQINYSLGLRNMGVDIPGTSTSPTYHNRVLQASITYLFAL